MGDTESGPAPEEPTPAVPFAAGPRDDMPEDMLALRDLLNAAALARATVARTLKLPVHDLAVLEHVMMSGPGDAPGPRELGRRLGVTPAAVTQSVHRLEAGGHLVRRAHGTDRRRLVLEITPSGQALVMLPVRPLLEALERSSRAMPDDEREIVTRYLAAQVAMHRAFVDHLLAGPATAPA